MASITTCVFAKNRPVSLNWTDYTSLNVNYEYGYPHSFVYRFMGVDNHGKAALLVYMGVSTRTQIRMCVQLDAANIGFSVQ